MAEELKHYNPLVSVIIPCYNGEKYLAEALDSILNQSYTNWECIVADDGSTDKSKEVTLDYIRKDNRFRYVYQVNSGPSAARNLGIKISSGEYLQFLDSDDMIEKEKLKKQVEILQNFPCCDLVYGDTKYFTRTPDGQIDMKIHDNIHWKQGRISGEGDKIIRALLEGNIMVVDSPLIRRTVFEKIGLWDEQIWFNEDWDVWTRCALAGLSFRFDDTENTNALVRFHEESRSRDLFKMFLHGLKVCLKINRSVIEPEYKKIIKPKIYFHQRFLDKELLAKYKVDKPGSFAMASSLSNETGLFHYRVIAWLIHYLPYSFSMIYTQYSYLFNRVKRRFLYES